jgi:broad specificity phosphatase PhoE
MIKLYLFRHGETNWNKEHRIQCRQDTELNETGLKQAEDNAEFLKDKGIQYIYSSPLKRARWTADALARKINVEIENNDGLMELDGGSLEGKFKHEIIEALGNNGKNYEIFSNSRHDGMDIRYPNGESKREIRNRIIKTLTEICKKTSYQTIGVASHGFTLREFIRSTDFDNDSSLENCEVIEVEYDNGKFAVKGRFK